MRSGPAFSCSQFSVQFSSFIWPTPFIVESVIFTNTNFEGKETKHPYLILVGASYENPQTIQRKVMKHIVLDQKQFQHFGIIQKPSTLEGIHELRINILSFKLIEEYLTFVEQKSPIVPLYYILFLVQRCHLKSKQSSSTKLNGPISERTHCKGNL